MKRTFRVAAFVCTLLAIARADLDLDGNGLGDVWEAKYRPAVLLASGDEDGDGRTNLEECEAGTDPFAAEDIFAIRDITPQGEDLLLRWPTQAGKRYQVQRTATPGEPSSWDPVPGHLEGTGGELEISTPRLAGPLAFYRIVAADVDTDGDGLTDWEEIQAGYDPHADHQASCGCGETCGCGPDCVCGGSDLERLTEALQGTPVVSISATDADATEPASGNATDTATFRIRRRGGIGRVTVSLAHGGTATAADHEALPGTLILPLAAREAFVTLIPRADPLVESPEIVSLSLQPGGSYTLGSSVSADALIHDSPQANGSGLTAEFWKHPTTAQNSPYFENSPTLVRVDPVVNFDSGGTSGPWPGAPITSDTASNYFSSRWSGEVMPEFSQAYTFYIRNNDAGRLWVNGALVASNWPPSHSAGSERSGIISLEGGKRYPIVFEHFNNTGGHSAILSWQSQSQGKQVVPQSRLFADTPPRVLGPFEAHAFVGGPSFHYRINASGNPLSYAAANLPPGLSLDPESGIIGGDPTAPGEWKVTLTATNARGSGSAFLQITVIETGGGITREVWTGVPGGSLSQIPLSQPPSSTSLLASLQAPADEGDGYGARLRGFLTAPETGEYRFFLRADEAAVFLLSDDEEPVNSWKRAELVAPAAPDAWAAAAQSPLLHLEAGRRYYLEILHKEDTGPDHLSLGWWTPGKHGSPADPDADTADLDPPSVVPGHLLTRFEDVALGSSPDGSLHVAALTPQAGAVTNAYGSATLRLSADKTTAWVTPIFGNLGSAFFAMHVHDDRLPPTSNIVFDLDEPGVEILADGSYVWHITGVGPLSAAEIADGISQHAFLNVHSVDYPGGEIKGYFRPLDGSSSFTPPPPPPDWSAEPAAAHTADAAAARFLMQATFGANREEIDDLKAMSSFEQWIDSQFALPAGKHLPWVEANRNVTSPNNPTYGGNLTFNSWWKTSIGAEDQLRQRVAFALSEIMVVSESGVLADRANALSSYYDMLLQHSFGNVRDLLEAVTLHPAMGRYLDMLRNDKPSLTAGRIPNENYAREILQLFSLGLYRMHPDGSLILNSKGLPVPVYDQESIIGYAHVFTGWDYGYSGSPATTFSASSNWTQPMREVPARHFTGRKRLLNNIVLPGLDSVGGVPLDPYGNHGGATIANDPAFQALPRQELDYVHDQLFNHPNIGPFLCRQLIQRLVTSTPSRGYIHRVTGKFNDNGSGVRGDMKAVIKAILLDYEARSMVAAAAPGFGKQSEPVVRVARLARAFRPVDNFAGSYVQDGGLITVDTAPFAHRLANNQKILLGFTGSPLPSQDGEYTAINPIGTTTFATRTRDIHRGTWAQTGTVISVTTLTDHGFAVGQSVYLRFRSGAGANPADGVYVVTAKPSNTGFEIAAPDSASRAGACDAAWLRGSYSQALVDGTPVLTVTCGTLPGLGAGDRLVMTFTATSGQAVAGGNYVIDAVDGGEPRRFTLLPESGSLAAVGGLAGTFHAAPYAPVLDRSGTVSAGYSSWKIDSTDTDLGQTPLNSPTVFNFFEPGYRHPGALAANGLDTPEFQLSSDTNVIRQANYLFGGIYSHSSSTTSSSTYTNGLNSFKNGNQAMTMDFSPWMGPRPGGGYWTDTANLRDLIRELGLILTAGPVDSAMEDRIHSFVSNTANIPYGAAPTETERRNRARAVIYFIAVSPDFAIQR